MEIKYTKLFSKAIEGALSMAKSMAHEYVTPEHILFALCNFEQFAEAITIVGGSIDELKTKLNKYLQKLDKKSNQEEMPDMSYQFQMVIARAAMIAERNNSKVRLITIPFIVEAIFALKDSFAEYLLTTCTNSRTHQLIEVLNDMCQNDTETDFKSNISVNVVERHIGQDPNSTDNNQQQEAPIPFFIDNISEMCSEHPPIIGRTEETIRMVENICRCDNNNIILVGEHGVGKTTMVFALAQMIRKGNVPKRLKSVPVLSIDVVAMTSGVQYKGEIENRMHTIIEGIKAKEGNAIICLEGLQNIIIQNQGNDNNVDIVAMIGQYLTDNSIAIICTLTPDEMSKLLHRSKQIMQHFQRIDISEPDTNETIEILNGIKDKYEQFHKVEYSPEAIRHAVEISKKHIRDRFLPEKAIDLIDQTGAHIEAIKRRRKDISTDDIDETLRLRYNIKAVGEKDETTMLQTLAKRMKTKIYGQDEAIDTIVSAVQLWKSGLSDPDKPIANLLFVGPTGVGKTEVARTLAEEMGIPLQRFDMSEYVEKHTVAKLIGSPAGYVGYDDGGLLTEAIIKNPNCVLLLDEIEKAHPDIYNILLQVMDYGSLTDSRGQKASFQNVIIIMTSNAGAQYARMASLGFGTRPTSGDAMLTEVKKIFKPEFINRLTGTIVFNDMNKQMASLIFAKKILNFYNRLSARQVKMILSIEAREWLLAKGITEEYGAREIDRVINNMLKPIFVKEILFGKLKKGGDAHVVLNNDALTIEVPKPETIVNVELHPDEPQTPQKKQRKTLQKKSDSNSKQTR